MSYDREAEQAKGEFRLDPAKLVAARHRLGVSQVQLAQAAGVPFFTYLKVEQGTNTRPRMDTALKIARALELSVSDLLVEAALPPPDPAGAAERERQRALGRPEGERSLPDGPGDRLLALDMILMLADPKVDRLLT